jgi:hypothetical protein
MLISAHLLRRIVLISITGSAVGIALLASPLGRIVDRQLSSHFQRVNYRREHHQLTRLDIVECQLLYNSIAIAGRTVSPEAGAIVWAYLHNEGKDLWLDSSYLQTSPVIRRSWQSLKLGESRQFSLRRQAEDWRLSYALNPFSLRRDAHEILLWQRMEFSSNPRVRTTLNYGLGSVKLPDALIHALHPQPFTVYSKWRVD